MNVITKTMKGFALAAIAALAFAGTAKAEDEVTTISSFSEMVNGGVDGWYWYPNATIYTTFGSADMGALFAEDDTAGVLLLDWETDEPICEAGYKLTGNFYIAYSYGDNVAWVKDDGAGNYSNYSMTPYTKIYGKQIKNVDELKNFNNWYRLVTIDNSEENNFTLDSSGYMFIGDMLTGNFALYGDLFGMFEEDAPIWPNNIDKITGVFLPMNVSREPQGEEEGTRADDEGIDDFGPSAILAIAMRNPADTEGDNIYTIGDLYKMNLEEDGVLGILKYDNAKCTYSNEDMGLCILEDESGAMPAMLADGSTPFEAGTMVNGKVWGELSPFGTVYFDFTEIVNTAECKVEFGRSYTAEELSDFSNNYRLVTITTSKDDELEYVYLEEDMRSGGYPDAILAEGGKIAGYDMMGVFYDYETGEVLPWPENPFSFTGFNYVESGVPMATEEDLDNIEAMVIFRSADDVKGGEFYETLADFKKTEYGTYGVIEVNDLTVTYANDELGFVTAEDEEGAYLLAGAERSVLAARGDVLNGYVWAQNYVGGRMEVYPETADFEISEADVTKGALLTVAEANDPANAYRLVTFVNSEETPVKVTELGPCVDNVYAVDAFDNLGEDFEWPEVVNGFTGIIMPTEIMPLEEDENPAFVLVALRDLADLDAESGIATISYDGAATEADVYDLRGVRVRNAGESLEGLAPGFYVRGNQKVLVK